MNNHLEKHIDEIDLKAIFLVLWHGKIFIILMVLLSIFLAAQYLHKTERKYTVEYNLKPVGETDNGPNLGGLGGLAGIAGIELPVGSNNDFEIFKKLITSVEVSKIIFDNKKIIRGIFESEWNEKLSSYSPPPRSQAQTFINNIKKLLTGKEKSYMPPNPRRLAIFIAENIQIIEEKDSGFLRFLSDTSEPELILLLITEATKISDEIMRQRYVDFSTEPLAFYKEKLRTARSREHREALAELIANEEQKLMLASRGKYFIAEPYIEASISLYPSAPKPNLILVFSVLCGVFIGVVILLIRNAITKDN